MTNRTVIVTQRDLPAMQRAVSLLLLLLVGVCFASIVDVSFLPNSVPDCPAITKSLQKCARAVTLGRSQGCQFTLTLKFGTGSELLSLWFLLAVN